MLTCEICGEEIMWEEDMKSHLLLSHLENELNCPLCSLSGVSYDELCFHISSAHPENQAGAQGRTQLSASCSAGVGTSSAINSKPPTSQFCVTARSCAPAVDVTADSVRPEDNVNSMSARGLRTSVYDAAITATELCSKVTRSSPEKAPEQFSCPMCDLVCSSSSILQEHVELHLQEQHPTEGEKRLECPLCSVVFSNSFTLQEHVDLHLDCGPGSPGSDLKLARELQQEMDERRREDEARKEKEEFTKLQTQFGLDGSGGYRRQMERTFELEVARGLLAPTEYHNKRAEMMESLSSGIDDGKSRTQGVMEALYEYYQTEGKDCVHVWLSADTDHYSSSAGDKGWGCGYRNFQMMLSALHKIDSYASFLQEKAVPSIPRLQSMMEEAWKEGLDPQGASHFNQRLQGTRAWIGATEIYVLLTSLGIKAHIIDFHQPTGPGGTHPQLFDWVKQYFCQSCQSSRLPPRLIQTCLPPLYLQHQGHSRSVVGLEQRKNGSLCILLFDPAASTLNTRSLMSRDTVSSAVRHLRKFPSSLKQKQYQVVAVKGVLSAEEKQPQTF